MPAPYDYAASGGYARTRADWLDFPSTSTPITQAQLDQLDQALFDVKTVITNVKDFGAVGNGTTDDTTAFNNALSACPTGGTLYIPPGSYKISTFTINKACTIIGSHRWNTKILASSATANVFDVTAWNVQISQLAFWCAAAVTRTAGAFVKMVGSYQTVSDCQFVTHFVGILAATTIGRIRSCDFADGKSGAGSAGIVLGIVGTASSETFFIEDVVMDGTAPYPEAGIRVDLADGTVLANCDIIHQGWCLYIKNTTAFYAYNSFFDTATMGIRITPSGTMNVLRAHFIGCWSSGHTSNGVWIDASGTTGFIHGIEFIGHQAISNAGDGLGMAGTTTLGSVKVDGGLFSANTGAGIQVSAGSSNWAVTGAKIGSEPGLSGNAYGIFIAAGASNNFRILGNDLTGNTTLNLSNSATGALSVIRDNLAPGVPASIASATTTTLPGGDVVTVTGTTTITSVTASYSGRRVTLVFSGILTFTDGSNLKLAGNFVTTADDTITLVCDGTNWFEVCRSVN